MKKKTITPEEAQAMLKAMPPLRDIPVNAKATLAYRAELVEIVSRSVRDPHYVARRDSLIDKATERVEKLRISPSHASAAFLLEMDNLWRQEAAHA